jgi:hypothetical protein
MKRVKRSRGVPTNLSTSLQHRLGTYVLAAGAAGVSVLALTTPSEAEIVYTSANEIIGRNGSYKLDLNHDGIIDFILVEHAASTGVGTFQRLSVEAANGNGVNCIVSSFCISTYIYAAAWEPGTEIGVSPLYGWIHSSAPMAQEQLLRRGGSVFYYWPWANISDRYLGLKFKINGQTHYGWARLTVKFHGGLPKNRTWEAHLTGYAYETIAGKSIIAGKTQGASNDNRDDENTSGASFRPGLPELKHFAALGTLALGASGIPLWRREECEGVGRNECQ